MDLRPYGRAVTMIRSPLRTLQGGNSVNLPRGSRELGVVAISNAYGVPASAPRRTGKPLELLRTVGDENRWSGRSFALARR